MSLLVFFYVLACCTHQAVVFGWCTHQAVEHACKSNCCSCSWSTRLAKPDSGRLLRRGIRPGSWQNPAAPPRWKNFCYAPLNPHPAEDYKPKRTWRRRSRGCRHPWPWLSSPSSPPPPPAPPRALSHLPWSPINVPAGPHGGGQAGTFNSAARSVRGRGRTLQPHPPDSWTAHRARRQARRPLAPVRYRKGFSNLKCGESPAHRRPWRLLPPPIRRRVAADPPLATAKRTAAGGGGSSYSAGARAAGE